jgi:apolipoprotein N-acyltransferase
VYAAAEFVIFALAVYRTGPGPLALAAPLSWVTLEFLYPNLFPWRLANSQWHAPVLIQIGDVTGPFGLSFVMVWIAAALVVLVRRGQRTPLAAAAAATAAVVVYGVVRLPAIDRAMQSAPVVTVGLVQGNVSIREKGDIRYFDINLAKYQELSEDLQGRVDVIVWPETVSQRWVAADTLQLDGKDNPFEDLRGNLIFGGLAFRLHGRAEPEQFNSAFLLGPNGVVLDRYDKHVLMPFGEYIPLASYFPAIYALSPETGSFTPGTGVSVFDVPGKVRIGQLICYEDLLAGMSRAATRAGAEVLLNILNDAWYGNTAAPYQHQALALWRAIENRRYLLRGSNSGVTSIIDAAGRVVAQGGLFTAEAITGRVHRLQLTTFYTRYGDVFAWGVVAGALLLLATSRLRPRQGVVR